VTTRQFAARVAIVMAAVLVIPLLLLGGCGAIFALGGAVGDSFQQEQQPITNTP
jgi:hypothetical protein